MQKNKAPGLKNNSNPGANIRESGIYSYFKDSAGFRREAL